MQSNKACMKDILNYVVQNTKVKVNEEDMSISLLSTNILTVSSELIKGEKYSREEVIYNIIKCHKYRLIDANIPMNGNYIPVGKDIIFDITIDGEKFLNDKIDL